jgi:hypothetical protein
MIQIAAYKPGKHHIIDVQVHTVHKLVNLAAENGKERCIMQTLLRTYSQLDLKK